MSADNIIDLSAHRAPVFYTIDIVHHWDGRLEVLVHDLADDPRSRASVADTLERVLELYRGAAQ